MSFLRGVFKHEPQEVHPVPLNAGELELFRTVGSVGQGITSVGGDIVVTDQRIAFTPLNIDDLAKLATCGLKMAAVPHSKHIIAVVGWAQSVIRQSALEATSIVGISIGQQTGTLTRPPSVIVRTSDQESIELGVLAGRWSPNMSRKNMAARDDLIRVIQRIFRV